MKSRIHCCVAVFILVLLGVVPGLASPPAIPSDADGVVVGPVPKVMDAYVIRYREDQELRPRDVCEVTRQGTRICQAVVVTVHGGLAAVIPWRGFNGKLAPGDLVVFVGHARVPTARVSEQQRGRNAERAYDESVARQYAASAQAYAVYYQAAVRALADLNRLASETATGLTFSEYCVRLADCNSSFPRVWSTITSDVRLRFQVERTDSGDPPSYAAMSAAFNLYHRARQAWEYAANNGQDFDPSSYWNNAAGYVIEAGALLREGR